MADIDPKIKEFEEQFTELLNVELQSSMNMPFFFNPSSKFFLNFQLPDTIRQSKNLFYFMEIICYPYKNEIKYDNDAWVTMLINHTVKRLIIDKAEDTFLLSAVRMYYLLWIGIQKKVFSKKFLIDNFANIFAVFDIKYPCLIIQYTYLVKYYPEFAKKETLDNLKLALTLVTNNTELVSAVFDE